ncbi:MAG: hypothetical protein WCG10_04530 [Chlamydiota bacterium]
MNLQIARNGFNHYIRDLPQASSEAVGMAGVLGFGLETLLSRSLRSAKIACIASCTATAIHALITPLFKYVIGNHRLLNRGEELLKTAIAFTTTATLFYAFGIPLTMQSFLIQFIFQVSLDLATPYIPLLNQLQASNRAKSIILCI